MSEAASGAAFEADVTALARRIAELGAGEATRLFRQSWWSERMMQWAMGHPDFKTQLFRFVDVFPATTTSDDVLRHIHEYFQGTDAPRIVDFGIDVAERMPFGGAISASVARRNIERMAEQFIVGSSPAEAVAGLHQLWRNGSAFTVDLLGEKTVAADEADRYAARVHELLRTLVRETEAWAPEDALEFDDLGRLPRVNVSVKPTALAPSYAPLTGEDGLAQAEERLLPILREAAAAGAFVYLDMEHYDVKDLTIDLFRRLLDHPDLADLDAGIVIQAYLKDAAADLRDLIDWSRGRRRPIGIRLVKGAYWDSETIVSRAEGWPVPVFESKVETDASYEHCARLLHDAHGQVRAAFASHNLRSLAYAVTSARAMGIPDSGYELQMLYGMAEPIHAAVRRLGLRLRVYAPVGELVPGMAYLVRRLLENTSNESFVRQRFTERRKLDDLLAAPVVDQLPGREPPARRPPTDVTTPGPYHHEPHAELRRREVRAAFASAVRAAGSRSTIDVPAVIDGERVRTSATIDSVDPGRTDRVVARSASCSIGDVEAAMAVAQRSFESWHRRPVEERAAVLFRTAEVFRQRREELAALQVFEAGKPWKEADGDICEAIDFCEYYGRQALQLQHVEVDSPPGERNDLRYRGRGVVAVIAPWNFPLAIPCGMVVAALVAGNSVLFKPAEQTPATALRLVEALAEAGLPKGVLSFLPGIGEDIGPHLVEHPNTSVIAFTGSKAVGLSIVEAAGRHVNGQRQVKRVIAEMGGKNPLIVDADADLDAAVPAILQGAFGYAGQKCSATSRLIVHEAVHDELVHRLAGAVREMRVGHPSAMAVQVGPVIDADAHRRVRSYADLGATEGRLVTDPDARVPSDGWYVAPTIVTDVAPDSRIVTEEIFGPVLAVLRVPDIESAVEMANDTDYALTAGLLSRSPANIEMASAELRAGNVYVNRSTTGAVVGRQPFGGFGLSGVGSKAGGPHYLLQMVDPVVVTENTLRQGFAPEEPEPAK